MITDVVNIFVNEFDRCTFSVNFLDCLNDLRCSDTNFDIIVPNTLQPVKLIYCHNIATITVAVIFVHSNAKGLVYDGAEERAEMWL